ncbi:hypothetical protein [Streptomyces sp. NPDC012510]|uniref:hypothetical protein n=1 Tax=Streptomyces sp. NPDC012510 TaxID=3364838 RepID=UPI0036E4622F
MRTRKITVIAASVGVAVAAATGVTYASSALDSAPKSAAVTDAAPAPRGGNGTGTNAGSNAASDAGQNDNSWRQGKGNEGRGGNGGGNGGENRGGNGGENRGGNGGENHGGNGGENRGDHHRNDGQIMVNDRTYAAEPGSCISVISDVSTFNIRNDSYRTVEFFAGSECAGSPIATVGPHGSNNTVTVPGAAPFMGSFRVIHGHDGYNGHH